MENHFDMLANTDTDIASYLYLIFESDVNKTHR